MEARYLRPEERPPPSTPCSVSDVLFFIELDARRVHLARVTACPTAA